MKLDLNDLTTFAAVARAGGFRDAAKATGMSVSRVSDGVSRLERRLGVRLFNRNTRSVMLTDAGRELLLRIEPSLGELGSALDAVNRYRETPAGTLRLDVPVSAAKLILSSIVPEFLMAYPDVQLEVVADSQVHNVMDAGFDAGIRYEERLEQDMIAIPIGPRRQRFAAGAAPALLSRRSRPQHPQELQDYPCLAARLSSGMVATWEFEQGDELVRVQPSGPLIVNIGSGVELAVEAAVAGTGVVYLFEQWLQPFFDDGRLVPILEPWWLQFDGPYLYYSGRKLVPAPLRAFIDFIKALHDDAQSADGGS